MHLVGFTIEIFYDARPYECQTVTKITLSRICLEYLRNTAKKNSFRLALSPHVSLKFGPSECEPGMLFNPRRDPAE